MPDDIRGIEEFYRHHTVDEYLEHHWPERSAVGFLRENGRRGLSALLHRLDALDRGDPFWLGTNRCPTLYKLGSFWLSEVAGSPDDVVLSWARIGMGLIHESHFPGSPELLRIYASSPFSPVSLLHSAYSLIVVSEAEYSDGLFLFLRDTGYLARTSEIEAELVEAGAVSVAEWLSGLVCRWRSGLPGEPDYPEDHSLPSEDYVRDDYVWQFCHRFMSSEEALARRAAIVELYVGQAWPDRMREYIRKRHGIAATSVTPSLRELGLPELRRELRIRVETAHPEAIQRCHKCGFSLSVPGAVSCARCAQTQVGSRLQ